jgi:hypothetical protein
MPGSSCRVRGANVEAVLTTPKDADLITHEIIQSGFEMPTIDQWEEALALRNIIESIPSGWFLDEPLEDVYQAALHRSEETASHYGASTQAVLSWRRRILLMSVVNSFIII